MGDAVKRRDRGASSPTGVPNSASNSSRVDLLRLREELEDAAAAVVEDDDPHRRADLAKRCEAVHVVEEAEVAGDDPGRRAARRRRADPRGDEAVDAVGAAVGQEADRRGPGRRNDSWSRIGIEEAV